MPVVVVGVSHHRTPPAQLGALPHSLGPELHARVAAVAHDGLVLLATCNRFEVYADTTQPDALAERLDLGEGTFVLTGADAVSHLFEVAAGLDSMVVGESEIAGQVRRALAEGAPSSPALRRLFDRAVRTSRAVAATGLGAAGRSVASVGLDLVEAHSGRLSGRRALLLGTGCYARVVTAELRRRGATIDLHSASGRAEAFAATHPVTPVADLRAAIGTADLLVACRGGATPAVDAEAIRGSGRTTPLPVLDLVPGGDLSQEAASLPGVRVVGLAEIGEHASLDLALAVDAAHAIVQSAVEAFVAAEDERRAAPAVVAIRDHVARLIDQEVASAGNDPATQAAVVRSLRRVSAALLHTPSVRAAESARTGELDDYHLALRTLFGIEVGA